MQNNRLTHARRILLGLGTAALIFGLSGCQTPAITLLSPNNIQANPSQIYTISARVSPPDAGLIKDSVVPRIIINQQSYTMVRSPLGNDIFEFDYQVPFGVKEIKYYILTTYQVIANDLKTTRESWTDVQTIQIVDRYVLSLEVNRGPAGARVAVLGRGFTPQDVVYFETTPVRSVFESPNSVAFFVPDLPASQNYRVSIGSSTGTSDVGTFRIDGVVGVAGSTTLSSTPTLGGATPQVSSLALTASPASLNLKQGESASLTFTSPITATAGGLLIDITTDVPDSVIMPEVLIPAGSNTVTITVQGGAPGTGTLYVKGAGAKELTIPVSVK